MENGQAVNNGHLGEPPSRGFCGALSRSRQ